MGGCDVEEVVVGVVGGDGVGDVVGGVGVGVVVVIGGGVDGIGVVETRKQNKE